MTDETNGSGAGERCDEFAAERRAKIIEALSWWEDEDGRWGHERASDVLAAHEVEWCGVSATPDAADVSDRGCGECGPGCTGHAASTGASEGLHHTSCPAIREGACLCDELFPHSLDDARLSEAERDQLSGLVWPVNYADPDLDAICEAVERIVAARESAAATRARAEALREVADAQKCGGCKNQGSHRRHCPRHPNYHPWIPLADHAESIGDSIGEPGLANQAWALAGAIRAEMPNHPYRPARLRGNA